MENHVIIDDEDEYKEFLTKNRKKQALNALKGIVIVVLFVLSYFLIQLGFAGGDQGMSYTTLGFLLICMLSSLMSIQPAKKKDQRQTLAVLGCTDPKCKGKKVRDYQDGDYIYKEEGKCAVCDGMLRIEEIYSVKLKNPKKESKQVVREKKKVEITPRMWPWLKTDHFAVAGLGGTFDHLHEGHYFLLKAAFKVAEKVIIGLTTDALLKNKAYAEYLQPYEIRQQKIIEYVSTFTTPNRLSFVPLSDPFGPAITSKEMEVLVISAETLPNAEKVNQIRVEQSLMPVVLVVIPLFPNSEGKKLSSTEIRAKLASDRSQKIK